MALWKVKCEDADCKDTFYVEAEQAADAIRIVLDTTAYQCRDVRFVRRLDYEVLL